MPTAAPRARPGTLTATVTSTSRSRSPVAVKSSTATMSRTTNTVVTVARNRCWSKWRAWRTNTSGGPLTPDDIVSAPVSTPPAASSPGPAWRRSRPRAMTTTATTTEQPMTTRRTRSSTSWNTSRPIGRPTAAPASKRSATGRSVWRRPVHACAAFVNVARNSATTTASWAPTAIDSSGTAVRPNPNPAASCTVAASATASAAPVRPAASRCTPRCRDQAPAQSATTGVSSSSSRRVSASGCTSGVGAACTIARQPERRRTPPSAAAWGG